MSVYISKGNKTWSDFSSCLQTLWEKASRAVETAPQRSLPPTALGEADTHQSLGVPVSTGIDPFIIPDLSLVSAPIKTTSSSIQDAARPGTWEETVL